MNFSGFMSICFMVVLVLWIEIEEVNAQSNGADRNYITWDDLTVSGNKFHDLRDNVKNQENIIVVDKNGHGNSVTVQGAVDMVPDNNAERVKIHILPGIYSEKVHIPITKPYISFIGDPNQASETVITWHDKAFDTYNGGTIGTWRSASVAVESDYFCASEITFQNSVVFNALDGDQAVALRLSGDKSMLYKTRILGSQDTLLDDNGTHYFLQCYIEGSVDFIFGFARSLYQECTISVVGNPFAITAHSRNSPNEVTGFSFVKCNVTGNGPVYLGRAWGDYARVIYSYCDFNINVFVEGWDDWGVSSRHNTVLFGEYECEGKGADRSGRAAWSKELSYEEAKLYLYPSFISGELWLRI